jgi:hypothetical protein
LGRPSGAISHSAHVSRYGDVAGIGLVFVEIGQRDERSHRVDVLGRRALGEAILEPLLDHGERRLVAGLLEQAPQAEQADAVGPFPACPALGVDDASVFQVKQELARLVLDVQQIVDQLGDRGGDGAVGHVMGEGGQLKSPVESCGAGAG